MKLEHCSFLKRNYVGILKKSSILSLVLAMVLLLSGCAQFAKDNKVDESQAEKLANEKPLSNEQVVKKPVDVPAEIDELESGAGKLVDYDVVNIGRSNPFMPQSEAALYEQAKIDAIAEANEYNAKLDYIKKNKDLVIREADDTSPYAFNLPVPPTAIGSETSAAARIVKTKVVGIMYSKTSPTAIINFEDKDYLVRPNDKIIGGEYKVLKISPSWITVGLGSNVYSASIGELFEKDVFDKSKNDLYNLRNRFGGRRS